MFFYRLECFERSFGAQTSLSLFRVLHVPLRSPRGLDTMHDSSRDLPSQAVNASGGGPRLFRCSLDVFCALVQEARVITTITAVKCEMYFIVYNP